MKSLIMKAINAVKSLFKRPDPALEQFNAAINNWITNGPRVHRHRTIATPVEAEIVQPSSYDPCGASIIISADSKYVEISNDDILVCLYRNGNNDTLIIHSVSGFRAYVWLNTRDELSALDRAIAVYSMQCNGTVQEPVTVGPTGKELFAKRLWLIDRYMLADKLKKDMEGCTC